MVIHNKGGRYRNGGGGGGGNSFQTNFSATNDT